MLNRVRTIWFMFRTFLQTLWCVVRCAVGIEQ